jgi:hypothetical protein
MGMPVKLSDELVGLARKEAVAAERSITAQIEHWAKLGRSVEVALRHEDALAVKASGGTLAVAFSNPVTRASVYQLLRSVAGIDHSELGRTLQRGRTVYESDPRGSGAIVRVTPDGTRTRGRFENRTFVPTAAPRRRARG